MAEPYRTELTALLDALDLDAAPRAAIDVRHFFSGAAAYLDGQIFASLSPVGLALKLPKATRERPLATGGQPLRYFPKAPVKKGYVVLADAVRGNREELALLVAESVGFATNPSVTRG